MHIDDVVGHSDGISNGLDEGHALDAAASIQHATKKHFQWNSPIEEVVLSRLPSYPPPSLSSAIRPSKRFLWLARVKLSVAVSLLSCLPPRHACLRVIGCLRIVIATLGDALASAAPHPSPAAP